MASTLTFHVFFVQYSLYIENKDGDENKANETDNNRSFIRPMEDERKHKSYKGGRTPTPKPKILNIGALRELKFEQRRIPSLRKEREQAKKKVIKTHNARRKPFQLRK